MGVRPLAGWETNHHRATDRQSPTPTLFGCVFNELRCGTCREMAGDFGTSGQVLPQF